MVNFVLPAEDAVKISPELVWLMIAAALPPMPPETESGAGVLVLEPIRTPDWNVEARTVLPEPLGVILMSLLFPVVIVVPVIEILLVPKSRVATPVMLLFAAFSVPPNWKALIWRVSLFDWMVFVPPPLKVRPAPFPVRVNPVVPPRVPLPARERLPRVSRTLAFEKKLILPVEPFPNWRVCLLLVPRTPVAVSEVAPVVPETEAVGVPPATLVTANLAELVAVPPRRKSCVVFLSTIALLITLKGDPPLATGRMPVMYCAPPPTFKAADERVP